MSHTSGLAVWSVSHILSSFYGLSVRFWNGAFRKREQNREKSWGFHRMFDCLVYSSSGLTASVAVTFRFGFQITLFWNCVMLRVKASDTRSCLHHEAYKSWSVKQFLKSDARFPSPPRAWIDQAIPKKARGLGARRFMMAAELSHSAMNSKKARIGAGKIW